MQAAATSVGKRVLFVAAITCAWQLRSSCQHPDDFLAAVALITETHQMDEARMVGAPTPSHAISCAGLACVAGRTVVR